MRNKQTVKKLRMTFIESFKKIAPSLSTEDLDKLYHFLRDLIYERDSNYSKTMNQEGDKL